MRIELSRLHKDQCRGILTARCWELVGSGAMLSSLSDVILVMCAGCASATRKQNG